MPNGKVYIQKRNFGALQAPDNFWLHLISIEGCLFILPYRVQVKKN